MTTLRRSAIVVGMLLVSLGTPVVATSDATAELPVKAELNERVLLPLFDALQQANLDVLKQLLDPEIYATYRTLFEQNPEYGGFLREYYQGTTFEVRDVVAQGADRYVAVVEVAWPDRATVLMRIEISPPNERGERVVRPQTM